MRITQATFVTSITDYRKAPLPWRPTYAFIGRSNVGKSALINMLLMRKDLAKVSSTPGKTKTINYFLINEAWYMVDLPGYGWARVSQKLRGQWHRATREYVAERGVLAHLFVLLDGRHGPQKADLEFITWLVAAKVDFSVVVTKLDGVKAKERGMRQALFQEGIGRFVGRPLRFFFTSARKKQGKEELLAYIANFNIQMCV